MATFDHGYALLVGVGAHRNPRYSLPTTVKDVRALEAILRHPERCAYDPGNIRVLHDQGATTEAIRAGLAWLKRCAEADPQATVLFYYSGHGGYHHQSDNYFLLSHDASNAASGLTAEELSAAFKSILAQRLLGLLDCCHAAGMIKDGAQDAQQWTTSAPAPHVLDGLKQGSGWAIISSSSGQQSSYIRSDNSLSIFTYHVLEALQGAGNLPDSREVKVTNLMNYVSDKVKQAALAQDQEQVPFMQAGTDDFAVALIRAGLGLGKGGWNAAQADAQAAIEAVINQVNVARGHYVGGNLTAQSGGINLGNASIGSVGTVNAGDSYAGDRVEGNNIVHQGHVAVTGGTIHGLVTGVNSGTLTYTSDSLTPTAPASYKLTLACAAVLKQHQEYDLLIGVEGTKPGVRYRLEVRAPAINESRRFEGTEVAVYITPSIPGEYTLRAILYDSHDVQIAQTQRTIQVE